MNGEVFEEWFKMRLLPNLPEKCVISLDNASYHCRQMEKILTISTLKSGIVKFMLEHGIEIPQPTPIKAVLLERIKITNKKKRYVIDEMELEKGHRVLRLPLCLCCLNAIEMVWRQLKSNVIRQNVYSDKPEKVLDLIRDVCDEITPEDWSNSVQHVLNEEDKFVNRDIFLDFEIKLCIVLVETESSSSDSDEEVHDSE